MIERLFTRSTKVTINLNLLKCWNKRFLLTGMFTLVLKGFLPLKRVIVRWYRKSTLACCRIDRQHCEINSAKKSRKRIKNQKLQTCINFNFLLKTFLIKTFQLKSIFSFYANVTDSYLLCVGFFPQQFYFLHVFCSTKIIHLLWRQQESIFGAAPCLTGYESSTVDARTHVQTGSPTDTQTHVQNHVPLPAPVAFVPSICFSPWLIAISARFEGLWKNTARGKASRLMRGCIHQRAQGKGYRGRGREAG